MISTDPMQETPLTLKERRPFSLTLTCEKQDKSRVDLTDCTLRMVIADVKRKGGDVKVSTPGALISAVDGTARFDIQGDDLNFGAGNYDMAITLVTAEGFESSIIEGPVELTHNPDPSIPADFSVIVSPLSLTARFLSQTKVIVRVHHHPDSVLLDAAKRAEDAGSDAGIAASSAAASAASASADAATASAAAAAAEADRVEVQGYRGDAIFAAQSSAASAAAAELSRLGAVDAETAAEVAAAAAQASAEEAADHAELDDRKAHWLSESQEFPVDDASVGDLAFRLNHTTGFVQVYYCQQLDPAVWSTTGAFRFVPTNPVDGKVLGVVAGKPEWVDPPVGAHNHDTAYIPQTADIKSIVKITQAAYDALGAKVADRLYVIVG